MSAEGNSTAMLPYPKRLLEFLSRSLTSFQSSQDVFRILYTLPHPPEGSWEPKPRRPSISSPWAGASNGGNLKRRLVVLDSSFNPPTKAHAQMAKSALQWAAEVEGNGTQKNGGRLMLLLAVNNADKAPKPASFPLRLAMMDAFGRAVLEELERDGSKSSTEIDLAVTKMPYFHDKARVISESGFYDVSQEATSTSNGMEQVFLAGFDTVIRIFNPKYYVFQDGSSGMKTSLGPFFQRARLRVTMRPDDEWGGEDEQEDYVKGLGEGRLDDVGGDVAWARRVDLVKGMGGGAVSSSKVRELAKSGKKEEVRKMVSQEVYDWIADEELYKV